MFLYAHKWTQKGHFYFLFPDSMPFLMEFKENSLSVNLFCVLCIHFRRRKQKVFNFSLYPSLCCCLVLFFTLYRCLFYSYGSKNFAIKIFSLTIYPFVVYDWFIASRTLFFKISSVKYNKEIYFLVSVETIC